MFKPQVSQTRHLSNSGRRIYSNVKKDNMNLSSDYSDPIYLSETYSKLLSQIHNLRKEVDPLVLVLHELQEQLNPGYSDPILNQEITQKIALLQAQQYDFDEEISRVRRQYSNEAKEKLDIELNQYRVELNEQRFDLNETNKMIKQAKTQLQEAMKMKNSNSQNFVSTHNQIQKLNNILNSLRKEGFELKQKYIKSINTKQSFYDRIDNLNNILNSIKSQQEKKKLELYKLKVSYENRKKNLIAQIQSNIKRRSKPQLPIKQEPNLNSKFNSSLRRIGGAPSRRAVPDKSKKVQIIPGIVKSVHSYNLNTSGGSNSRDLQQNELNRCKTPRRNDNANKPAHHSKPGLSLSPSASSVISSSTATATAEATTTTTTILPPSQPSKESHPRHHKLHFNIADPTVKVVKMHKNNDECNDFISFS